MKLARMARSSMRDIETLCCLVEGHRIVALALPFPDLFTLLLPQLHSPAYFDCLLFIGYLAAPFGNGSFGHLILFLKIFSTDFKSLNPASRLVCHLIRWYRFVGSHEWSDHSSVSITFFSFVLKSNPVVRLLRNLTRKHLLAC